VAKRKARHTLKKTRTSTEESKNQPAERQTKPSRLLSLIQNLKKVSSFLLIALVPLLAFLFQYAISRPYVVVDRIEVKDRNPFKHEFMIKNSGMTRVCSLNIALLNPDISTETGFRIGTYGDRSKDAAVSDVSRVEGVQIPPQQSFSFMPDDFIHFPGESQPKEAVITFRFRYSDFSHFIEYEDRVSYRLFSEGSHLFWKPVGPHRLSLNE
jgi:hypothetical protein